MSSKSSIERNESNYDLNNDVALLAQHFYQFNIHPSDRLIGCLLCVEGSNQLKVSVEPSSHQSSVLEIEMRGPDGQLINKIYEKPIRRLDALNENQSDRNQIITLKPGDVFFYHPLLAQSIIIEPQQTDAKILENLENLSSKETESDEQILGLNIFYGSADLTRVERDFSVQFDKSASFQSPLQKLNLVDQLFENEKDKELIVRDKDEQSSDLKLFNVSIYIGNSIVNLDQVCGFVL